MYEYKNEQWLKEKIEKYKTIAKTSKATGYPETSLKRWCDKYNIVPTKERKNSSDITKEFLIEQYKAGKEIKDICAELKCCSATIVKVNKKFGISSIDYNPKYMYTNKEWLIEQFEKYKTPSKVADETGYPRTCISRYAKEYNIRENLFTRNKTNYVNKDYFKIIDSSEKAYFLGFIMADGNMYKRKNGRLSFTLKVKSTDCDIVYRLANAIEFDVSKVKTRERYRKETLTIGTEIKVHNQEFCDNLVNLGVVPRKGGAEKLSDKIPREFIKDFIRGFWDGDGSVLKYKYAPQTVSLCSMSYQILQDISDFIYSETNYRFAIKKQTHNLYYVKVSKANVVYKILSLLYYPNCVALDRKYEKAIEIKNDYLRKVGLP